ncbi:hypothetical protein ANN_07073 [Periplaneta americana]|uniref:Reverse transcriptase n=1 Tax=Periplaneta americana TaxID=6978 RepID=A0ABQ8TFZ9_PERAM|nr:hypothetical protein ANN_07073 [Periplaneta americana]
MTPTTICGYLATWTSNYCFVIKNPDMAQNSSISELDVGSEWKRIWVLTRCIFLNEEIEWRLVNRNKSFNTTRCRHPGCNETETLGHVLGFCRKTELLRNNRHHKARTGIADVLKRRGWEVHEEIHCVSSLDSNRRADIVAIHRTQSKGIVLDPTIRFERDVLQAQHVDEEEKSIYESCIPYLSEKYNIPTSQWSVSGFLFDARCTWHTS